MTGTDNHPEPILPGLNRHDGAKCRLEKYSQPNRVTGLFLPYTQHMVTGKVRLSSPYPLAQCSWVGGVGSQTQNSFPTTGSGAMGCDGGDASISRSLVSIPEGHPWIAPWLGGWRRQACFEDTSSATHMHLAMLRRVEPVRQGTCAIYLVSRGNGKRDEGNRSGGEDAGGDPITTVAVATIGK